MIYKDDSDGSFTDAGEIDDDADSDFGSKKKRSPAKKKKTPAKKKGGKKSAKKSAKKSPKKAPASKKSPKKSPAKGKSPANARTLASVRKQARKSYTYDSESEVIYAWNQRLSIIKYAFILLFRRRKNNLSLNTSLNMKRLPLFVEKRVPKAKRLQPKKLRLKKPPSILPSEK